MHPTPRLPILLLLLLLAVPSTATAVAAPTCHGRSAGTYCIGPPYPVLNLNHTILTCTAPTSAGTAAVCPDGYYCDRDGTGLPEGKAACEAMSSATISLTARPRGQGGMLVNETCNDGHLPGCDCQCCHRSHNVDTRHCCGGGNCEACCPMQRPQGARAGAAADAAALRAAGTKAGLGLPLMDCRFPASQSPSVRILVSNGANVTAKIRVFDYSIDPSPVIHQDCGVLLPLGGGGGGAGGDQLMLIISAANTSSLLFSYKGKTLENFTTYLYPQPPTGTWPANYTIATPYPSLHHPLAKD